MTNEEIIKGLQATNEHIGKHFNEGGAWMAEFIDMAIKELERQMMPRKNLETTAKDCIRREELLNRLNERKISIPISETYTEDHKVGWKDGVFWTDVLEIFEELEGET